jgi:hypothetical protein
VAGVFTVELWVDWFRLGFRDFIRLPRKQCVTQCFIKFLALVRVVSVLTRNIPRMAGRRLIHVSTLSFGDVLNL